MSDDGKRVRCTACATFQPLVQKEWIQRGSLSKHASSEDHLKCVRDYTRRQKELYEARQRALASEQEFLSVGHVEFPEGLKKSTRQPQQRAAETEEQTRMWARYEMEGAHFSAGEDPRIAIDLARARLENQCDNLVFLSDDEVAKSMGLLDVTDDTSDAEAAQEDEALTQLLDDFGESFNPNSDHSQRDEEQPNNLFDRAFI